MHQHTINFAIEYTLPEWLNEDVVTLIEKWMTNADSYIFHSSGSTGIPKKIEFSRKQLEASAQQSIHALNLKAEDHFLLCLSVKTVGGAMLLVRAMQLRATITICEPNMHPLRLLSNNHPYTVASFVPTQLHDIIADPVSRTKLALFKTILLGGSAISYQLEKVMAALPCNVYHTYGMTETLSHIALRKIGRDAAFKLLPGNEIETDTKGRLKIKNEITGNIWLQTNDVIERIDAHQFKVLGRADRVINSGGVKIHAELVEEAVGKIIQGHTRFFVTGVPDEKLGQQVMLVIETKPWSEETIFTFLESLRPLLPAYHLPRSVRFLPYFSNTDSGKIDMLKTVSMLYS